MLHAHSNWYFISIAGAWVYFSLAGKMGEIPREVYMISLLLLIGYALTIAALMIYMHDRFGKTEVMIEVEDGAVAHVYANFPIVLTIIDWDTQDEDHDPYENAHLAYMEGMSIEGMTLVY